jgi:glutamate synthase domain-containing protein 3
MTTKQKSPETIDAAGVYYRDLNARMRQLAVAGTERVRLVNLYGQRYIATDLARPMDIEIHGTPGNDLGAFLNGSTITVHGNAQDGSGNTMNEGRIVIHGRAGDITGLAARGGKIFIRDGVGYRTGIHMKEYGEQKPLIVIGGTSQDFLAEYMAGGTLILLGLDLPDGRHRSSFVATGMHGGVVYIRGSLEEHQLGREVGVSQLDEADRAILAGHVGEFAGHFGMDAGKILEADFIKLYPRFLRPYGKLYTY